MAYIRKILRKKGAVYRAEICHYDGSKQARNFRTKEEAQQWARSEEDSKRSYRASGAVQVRITLDEFFEKWFHDYACVHHSKGWQRSDRRMYERFVGPTIGKYLLREVQPVDIQRVLREMLRAEKAASYANRVRTMLHKMFNEAVRTYRYLIYNPVSAVRPLKEDPYVASSFSAAEAKELLRWADGERYGIALHLALQLGLREGEIIGLKWDAIDFQTRSLSVRRKWDKNLKVLDEFVKGKKVRTLGIYPDGLLERLKLQRARFPESEFVVCQPDLSSVSAMQVIHTLKRGIAARGLKRVTVHGLRHTFASLYMQNGGDLYDLQKVMGHQSAVTTERYRHTDPEYLKKKCNIFDLYSGPPKEPSSAQIPPKAEKPQLRLVGGES